MDRTNGSNGIDSNDWGPQIMSLEIETDAEEEHLSLIHETSSEGIFINGENGSKKDVLKGHNTQGMRRRGWGGDGHGESSGNYIMNTGKAAIQGLLRTDLMQHAVYHLRNALLLGLLAFFVLVVLEWEGGLLRGEQMEETEPYVPPHVMSYGGKNNMGHNLDPNVKPKKPNTGSGNNINQYNDDEEAEIMLENEILDEAVEMTGTWDIAFQNNLNEQAHFLHDPNLSPYSSDLYPDDQSTLDLRQENFTKRMNKVIDTFGVWNNPNFVDARNLPDNFFSYYDYRDVPIDEFPDDVWQTDEEYIRAFLEQAQALVEATREGIMIEYNHPNPDDDERDLFSVIIGEHEVINGTAHDKKTQNKLKGVAYLPQTGWDGLVKKLLHAMITTDHFYVVVAGDGSAYRGNNLAQTQVMQFNYIMEPVFHKLGMTLISRNMGMDASPVVAALGGADIYGETDILWHFQDHSAEEKDGEFDLLQKQVVMSGERVPLIISPSWEELVQASRGKAWVGNIQPGADMCQRTTMEVLPAAPACHNVHCDTEAWENGQCHVYKSVCWEPRVDYNPEDQNLDAGDKDRQFPGYRQHQLEGRKMTILVLDAIAAALTLWTEQLDGERKVLPLSTEFWHVGETYEDIRKSVMSLDRIPGQAAGVPLCEVLLADLDPRICHIPMHARTEWTPRVIPQTQRLLAIINNMIEGEFAAKESDIYDGPDILPLDWQIPENELDVHMIAIASNGTAGQLVEDDDLFKGMDDDFMYDYDYDDTGDDGGGRRLMSKKSREKAQEKADQEALARTKTLTGQTTEISEGLGWRLENVPIGFCDGSAQSRCNRTEDNLCLLANHNHYKGSIVGTPQTGWLTMRVSDVKHGIVLARLEFGALPFDFILDYAVDGKVTSVFYSDMDGFGKQIVSDLRVFPLVLDKNVPLDDSWTGVDYDIALRIRSEKDPNCRVALTHIYYA